MHVTIDEALCIGCGLCASTCPAIFEMQDNVAIVKDVPIGPGDSDCALKMIKDCPVDAIKSI